MMDIENLQEKINLILKGDKKKQIASLTELIEEDISHKELGTTLDLQEAQILKTERCEYLQKIISDVQDIIDQKKYIDLHPRIASDLDHYFNQLRNFAVEVINFSDPNNQEQSTVSQLKGTRNQLTRNYKDEAYFITETLRIQIVYNELFTIKSMLGPATGNKVKEINRNYEKSKQLLMKIEQASSNVRDSVSNVSKGKASSAFSDHIKEHKKRGNWWLGGFGVSASLLLVTVIYTVLFWETPEIANIPLVILTIFKKLLLITTLGVAIRVCLSKYNIERHLEVTYKNRSAVLAQFGLFESQISSENEDAKNKLRLAIANIIFNDPNTGLIQESKNLSISPSMNVFEEAIKRTPN